MLTHRAQCLVDQFESITNSAESLEGHIYNVGQGNCIRIDINTNNNKETIFFDVGMSLFIMEP